jgi:spermidine/putrescine transport system substrate-binding protein
MKETMPSNEHDPRLDAIINQYTSRRRFLGRGALVLGGLAMGPTLLAACSSDDDTTDTTDTSAAASGPTKAEGNLRISNWPLYIGTDPSTVEAFQTASGVSVDYLENFNDNEEWFAKNKDALQAKQDIGADLVVPTDFMVQRLIALEWLTALNDANIPNKQNMRADLLSAPADPGRKYSMPWVSGAVGLGYNKALVNGPVTSIDDLFDPQYEGQVSMFSDLRDGLGMVMMSQGNSPADATAETVQQAADAVKEQSDKGQIRRFTGNDYIDDLSAGNLVICQAYSGDIAGLQADNPDLEFVIPEAGSTSFSDNMVIPYTTENQSAAEAWMNFIYDRANYAAMLAQIQYYPALSDMTDALTAVDPAAAENPLINPPQSTLDMLEAWKALSDTEEQELVTIYTDVTGG